VKITQELKQLFSIFLQNIQDRSRFAGVRDKHFEYMKRFKLNIPALVQQQVHHESQVHCIGNKPCHDIEVGTVKKKFPKELHSYDHLFIKNRSLQRVYNVM
jgi:hypothetical protein